MSKMLYLDFDREDRATTVNLMNNEEVTQIYGLTVYMTFDPKYFKVKDTPTGMFPLTLRGSRPWENIEFAGLEGRFYIQCLNFESPFFTFDSGSHELLRIKWDLLKHDLEPHTFNIGTDPVVWTNANYTFQTDLWQLGAKPVITSRAGMTVWNVT